jgi:hypothetical protein
MALEAECLEWRSLGGSSGGHPTGMVDAEYRWHFHLEKLQLGK